MTRPLRRLAATTALATVLVTATHCVAAGEGERIRIIGTPVGNSGWPNVADGRERPDLIEAGREPSAPVRARRLAGGTSADPDVREAMQELAGILRAAHSARESDDPSAGTELTFRATLREAAEDRAGRLRPEDLMFDPPSVLRRSRTIQASGLPDPGVPVPTASPRRQPGTVPLPRARPELRPAGAIRGIPVPRPSPLRTAAAATDRASGRTTLADPFAPWPFSSQDPSGAADPGRGGPARPASEADRAGADFASGRRLATAAPIIPLWTSSDDDAEREAPDEAGDDAADMQPLPPGPPPFRLVRMLTALQDDIARGAGAALAAQRILTDRISERFAVSLPREWNEPRNARALVIYALSGGSPAVMREVLKRATLEAPYDALGAGALAYLEGRANDARRHFGAVTDDEIDHSVRGPVYLARAALAVETDPAAALGLLERARLSAPATLVEEAALRRALLIAAETDDLAVFERMVERYLRKFRRSLYAGNFRQRLAAAVTRMSFINEPAAFSRLEKLLALMTDAGRQELYLHLARAAIENGNHRAAEIAAERAARTAVARSLDASRAALYRAAANVVDPEEFATAVATLEDLREAELPEDDRALLFAALRLSRTVTDLPPPDVPATMPAAAAESEPSLHLTDATEDSTAGGEDGHDGAAPAGSEDFDVAEVERRVTDALERIDQLLKETP